MCTDGCVEVELLIGYEEKNYNKLTQYECYQKIDDYGHINYAVMAYATTHGHIDCLKKLHKNGSMWHTDLAIVAAENDQIECLQYIIEEMGDITYEEKDFKYIKSSECLNYLMAMSHPTSNYNKCKT